MLLTAGDELGLDLTRSYLIGDAHTDLQAGWAVGCRCYMVLTGRGKRQWIRCLLHGEHNFRLKLNLGRAVNTILQQENGWGGGLRVSSSDGRSDR
ncbi:MAG: hypothetical protein DRI48_06435 [Chloroflexi bacterium]|nr:MAG: hypothetical protein DRI48_06435 [Chloroflexota bacterium]